MSNQVFIYHTPHNFEGKTPKKRVTVAGHIQDQVLTLAIARCRKGDTFSRKFGRTMAIRRLERGKKIMQFALSSSELEGKKLGEVFRNKAEDVYKASLSFKKLLQ